MTKLRIDVRQGTIEVEGEESFVREVFAEYKDLMATATATPPSPPAPASHSSTNTSSAGGSGTALTNAQPKKVQKKKKESYSLLGNLDLTSKGGKPSLKEFSADKKASSAIDQNAVFVYYLKKHANIDAVTVDHVYTCYKEVNVPVPTALDQSLRDTAFRKSYIDTASMTDIKLQLRGENFVEHELPKVGAKVKE